MAASATLPQPHYFRLGRNPSRIDAKRGDRFLQADFPLQISSMV